MNIDNLEIRLRTHPNQSFGSGTDEAEIRYAEKTLGVRLPNSYKSFLRKFGWGGVEHFEIFGLGPGVPEYLNVVKITVSEREDMRPAIPSQLVPIMNDGFGNHYCLETSRVSGNECNVVIWNHELPNNQAPEFVAKSFADWLNGLLDDL